MICPFCFLKAVSRRGDEDVEHRLPKYRRKESDDEGVEEEEEELTEKGQKKRKGLYKGTFIRSA